LCSTRSASCAAISTSAAASSRSSRSLPSINTVHGLAMAVNRPMK